jgi:hypothetical protein
VSTNTIGLLVRYECDKRVEKVCELGIQLVLESIFDLANSLLQFFRLTVEVGTKNVLTVGIFDKGLLDSVLVHIKLNSVLLLIARALEGRNFVI